MTFNGPGPAVLTTPTSGATQDRHRAPPSRTSTGCPRSCRVTAQGAEHRHQPFGNYNGGGLSPSAPTASSTSPWATVAAPTTPTGTVVNRQVLPGKILRINLGADRHCPYWSPPTNPYVGAPRRPEIWLYGVRNPWRFSFDAQTGDPIVADVGQVVPGGGRRRSRTAGRTPEAAAQPWAGA